MCEVTTILQVASIAFTAIGGIQQASAARATGRFNQQVAENNKIISDQRAADALLRGEEAEAASRRGTAQQIGSQKVAFGAGNISLGSGTPQDVIAGTATIGELNALTIRNNARRESIGFTQQGQNFRSEGELAAFEGKSKSQGTLLTTAGSVANKWYTFNQGSAAPTTTGTTGPTGLPQSPVTDTSRFTNPFGIN